MAGGSNRTHTVTAAAAPVAKKDPYAQNLVLALPLSVAGFDDVSKFVVMARPKQSHHSAVVKADITQMVPKFSPLSPNTMDEAITPFAAASITTQAITSHALVMLI